MRYLVLFGSVFLINGLAYGQQQERWTAPAEANNLINPYNSGDENVFAKGQDLYVMLCASCHGENGDGGGGAGQAFDPPPADFTKAVIQQQSDGALFWKLSEGNPPGMLSYKEILTEEERWQIVSYLRHFAKQTDKE